MESSMQEIMWLFWKFFHTYMGPTDSFPFIFILLLFQDQLNEQLLQFLVAIVDAQLLETVVIEDFETVDVQNADDRMAAMFDHVFGHHNAVVHALNDPGEKTFIDGLKWKS